MRRTVLCGRTFAGLTAVTAAEMGKCVCWQGGGVCVCVSHGTETPETEEAEPQSVILAISMPLFTVSSETLQEAL